MKVMIELEKDDLKRIYKSLDELFQEKPELAAHLAAFRELLKVTEDEVAEAKTRVKRKKRRAIWRAKRRPT